MLPNMCLCPLITIIVSHSGCLGIAEIFVSLQMNRELHLEMITSSAEREHDRNLKSCSAAFIPTSYCMYSVCQNTFNPIKPQDVHFLAHVETAFPLWEKDVAYLPFLQ